MIVPVIRIPRTAEHYPLRRHSGTELAEVCEENDRCCCTVAMVETMASVINPLSSSCPRGVCARVIRSGCPRERCVGERSDVGHVRKSDLHAVRTPRTPRIRPRGSSIGRAPDCPSEWCRFESGPRGPGHRRPAQAGLRVGTSIATGLSATIVPLGRHS
jgi:hypothetical protein